MDRDVESRQLDIPERFTSLVGRTWRLIAVVSIAVAAPACSGHKGAMSDAGSQVGGAGGPDLGAGGVEARDGDSGGNAASEGTGGGAAGGISGGRGGSAGTTAAGGGGQGDSGGSPGAGGVMAAAGRGGAAGDASGIGGATGAAGAGGSGDAIPGPHCDGVPPTCGPMGDADCCASSVVPGGAFNRGSDARFPATVSTFRLDTYEITVGRFRQFAAGYPGNKPIAGSGKNPNNPADPGWDSSWPLPADRSALVITKRCGFVDYPPTWTDTPGANETLALNCLNWYEAYAFCIWDGGRLPTEAEWNYAAAGGAEQRYYPWSQPPESKTIDPSYAVYMFAQVASVGSKSPKGDSRWGHADLGGNLWEWTQDWLGDYPIPCTDCANLTMPFAGLDSTFALRSDRGGGVVFAGEDVRTSERGDHAPSDYQYDEGARCARTP